MNFHNPTQTYLRPAANIGGKQQLRRRNMFDLPGSPVMWRAAGKVALAILPVVLSVNLFMVSAITDVGQSISAVDDKHHKLVDKNIELLAAKAMVMAPEHVMLLAGERLSLSLPDKGQVRKFNRRPGTFTYL